MRTKEITVYTVQELKEKFPDAYERAKEAYASERDDWNVEIGQSYRKIMEALGEPDEMQRKLSGKRAFSFFENNLFSKFRTRPGIGKDCHIVDYGTESIVLKRYAIYNGVGELGDCPFTGVCYDNNYIETIVRGCKNGDTVGRIIWNLERTAEELSQQDYEYLRSDDFFISSVEENEFDEYGKIV